MEELLNKKTAFHAHTMYSYDSQLRPDKIVDYLVSQGYGQVVITDHNIIDGAIFAKEYANRKYPNRFEVIIGEEVSTDIGHIIAFPLQKKIIAYSHMACFSEIKGQGAYSCLPHPYKEHDLFTIHTSKFLDCIDFVEIFNSRSTPAFNGFAGRYAAYFDKKGIIGSDAHHVSELNNASFMFLNSSLHLKILNNEYAELRHIRKSQKIKYLRRGAYRKAFKYFLLEMLNR